MHFKYGLDERPPFPETLLYGLQWFAITIPTIIVIGKISGGFHFAAIADQMVYLQKLMFVMSVALMAQLMLGHRMPLIAGPSSILLIGIFSSAGYPADTIYSSILCGGLLLAIASVTGLLGHLKKLFTPRVVAVVFILIAFTLTPTIVNLITSDIVKAGALAHIVFSLALVPGVRKWFCSRDYNSNTSVGALYLQEIKDCSHTDKKRVYFKTDNYLYRYCYSTTH